MFMKARTIDEKTAINSMNHHRNIKFDKKYSIQLDIIASSYNK